MLTSLHGSRLNQFAFIYIYMVNRSSIPFQPVTAKQAAANRHPHSYREPIRFQKDINASHKLQIAQSLTW